jgi:hypothetical protein
VSGSRNRFRKTLTITEVDIVGINTPAKVLLSSRQLHLCENRIGIDINKPSDLPIMIRKFQRARHIQEYIGAVYDVSAFTVRQTIPLVTDGETIRPSVFEAEASHERIEISDIFTAVVRDPIVAARAAVKVIRPLARIFKIVYIMTEPPKAEEILKVMPTDSPQRRMLRDQAGDNDAKRGSHNLTLATATICSAGRSDKFYPSDL